jgi:hypothetical protein
MKSVIKAIKSAFTISGIEGVISRMPEAYVDFMGYDSIEYYREDGGDWLGENAFLYAVVKDVKNGEFTFNITRDEGEETYSHFSCKLKAVSLGECIRFSIVGKGSFVSVSSHNIKNDSLYPVIKMVIDCWSHNTPGSGRKEEGKSNSPILAIPDL